MSIKNEVQIASFQKTLNSKKKDIFPLMIRPTEYFSWIESTYLLFSFITYITKFAVSTY
jgi:hypothetical protein